MHHFWFHTFHNSNNYVSSNGYIKGNTVTLLGAYNSNIFYAPEDGIYATNAFEVHSYDNRCLYSYTTNGIYLVNMARSDNSNNNTVSTGASVFYLKKGQYIQNTNGRAGNYNIYIIR